MKNLFACIAIVSTLVLSGCATQPIPVNYAPSSIKSSAGSLSVSDFLYLPASPNASKPYASKMVATNQIRNTAMGAVMIDRDVSKFIRDAVFSELRVVGIKTNDSSKVLSGEIEEFLIDDLGYSIDWTLRIKYVLTETTSQKVVFSSIKNTQRKTAKFANVFGALNETIKVNIEELIDDVEFARATR